MAFPTEFPHNPYRWMEQWLCVWDHPEKDVILRCRLYDDANTKKPVLLQMVKVWNRGENYPILGGRKEAILLAFSINQSPVRAGGDIIATIQCGDRCVNVVHKVSEMHIGGLMQTMPDSYRSRVGQETEILRAGYRPGEEGTTYMEDCSLVFVVTIEPTE